MSEHEVEVEEVERLPIEQIEEDPKNTRTSSWGDLEGLAQSMRARGQTTPGLVRPIAPGRYQLVCGARRLRALRLAGIAFFRAEVRELTDAEAHEERIVENGQRETISIVEEAESYRVAIEDYGRTIDELASRIGRDRRHIMQRLRILDLAPEARGWLDAGQLGDDAALAIAQLDPAVQQRVIESVRWSVKRDGRVSREDVRRATMSVQSELEAPGFDVDDAELVPGAVPCGACPKRSGAQGTLFGVLERDVCLDPACFSAKRDAAWARKSAEAKKAGLVVIEDPDALDEALHARRDHVRLDDVAYYLDADGKATEESEHEITVKDEDGVEVYDSEPHKPVTWRELLGAEASPVLARDRRGRSVELVPRDLAAQALERAGVDLKLPEERTGSVSTTSGGLTENDKARREKERKARKEAKEREAIQEDGVRRGWDATIAAVEAGNNGPETLRALVLAACDGVLDGTLGDVCRRRAWRLEDASTGEVLSAREAITRNSVDMDAARLSGLLADVIVCRSVAAFRNGIKTSGFELVARSKGVDLGHHMREAERVAREGKAGVKRGGRGKRSKAAETEASDAAE